MKKPDYTLFITFLIFGAMWMVIDLIFDKFLTSFLMIYVGIAWCLAELAAIKNKL